MEDAYIAVGLAVAALGAGLLLGLPSLDGATGAMGVDRVGAPGSAHVHASFAVAVNGSAVELGPAYWERARRVHLHGNDSVLHVHATNVDLGYALRTLRITANATCLRFGIENRAACGGVGVRINGETVGLDAALDRTVRQGDRILLWAGAEPPGGVPPELPPEYREPAPGRSV
ncbi:MAG: hypothetical protein SVU88_00525 [Candidatus Nanohaloarchaea archaeon]|nr:hypothetical protein [Candidatus Nanohaloarchaea archaeon]